MENYDAIGNPCREREVVDRQHDAVPSALRANAADRQPRTDERDRGPRTARQRVSSSDSPANTRASRTRARSPPESVVTVRCDHCVVRVACIARCTAASFSASLARCRNGIRPSATSVATSTGHEISGNLRQEGHASRTLVGGQCRERRAVEIDSPVRCAQQSGHAAEQRRFAGAIRAEHGSYLARRELHADRVENAASAALECQICGAQFRIDFHVTCLRIEYSNAKKNGAPISDIDAELHFRAARQQSHHDVAREHERRAPTALG